MVKKKPREHHEFLKTKGRSYIGYDKVAFQNTVVNNVLWDGFWNEGTVVDDLWNIMYTVILTAADEYLPETDIKLRSVRPGWMTVDTVEAINDKLRFYKLAKSTNKEEDWNRYKIARNNANRLMKSTKEQFVIQELENCGDDSRKLWRELHKHLGSTKHNINKFETIKDETETIVSGKAAYDYLNQYFTTIPAKLAQKHGDEDWNPIESAIKRDDNPFEFKYVTKDLVVKLIKEINVHKSSATPRLSTKLLKDAFEVLYDELCYMLNMSLTLGEFPDAWCIGHVIPLPKQGNLLSANNWRPITQIPLIGKLLEKVVNSQLQNYLENIDALNKYQFGFRKNKSTS